MTKPWQKPRTQHEHGKNDRLEYIKIGIRIDISGTIEASDLVEEPVEWRQECSVYFWSRSSCLSCDASLAVKS